MEMRGERELEGWAWNEDEEMEMEEGRRQSRAQD